MAVFSWVWKINSVSFGFALLSSVVVMQNLHHFFNKWEAKPKPNKSYLPASSHPWHQLYGYVDASSSDWFIALFASVMIGQNHYSEFGLTTLNFKTFCWNVDFICFACSFFSVPPSTYIISSLLWWLYTWYITCM